MKIALAQLNYHIGNFEVNFQKIKKAIDHAIAQQAELIVFAELAICGYPPRDFLHYPDFLQQCKKIIDQLTPISDKIAILIGGPEINTEWQGKRLYNAAYFLNHQKIESIVRKSLLPTYDVFDESRYFEANKQFETIHFKGTKIALTICEDIWNVAFSKPLYSTTPLDHLVKQNPDCIINIAASPFDYEQSKKRLQVIQTNCLKYQLPLLYVNHVGAQTELIFDGNSMAVDSTGQIIGELPKFEEAMAYFDTVSQKFDSFSFSNFQALPALQNSTSSTSDTKAGHVKFNSQQTAHVYSALKLGIQDYFRKLNLKKAVLGLSGGIDSAIVAALAQAALGSENVWAVLMPSPYSSSHSITDAIELAKNLKVKHTIIPIDKHYNSLLTSLQIYFENKPFDLTEENLQARLRALILMALSNKHGHILLNTSNKSEAAVGYGTLYGDMCGGLSVIGDVYKTQVYQLTQYINWKQCVIPENILTKAPSAELRPNQQDNQSLPEYDVLDEILYLYIEKQNSPSTIIEAGWDKNIVNKVVHLVNSSEHKRHQAPPILRISPKAFGMGRRMPIAAKYF